MYDKQEQVTEPMNVGPKPSRLTALADPASASLAARSEPDPFYRDSEPAEAATLIFIRRARDLGFPMPDIRELLALSNENDRSCAAVDSLARAS